MNTKWLFLPTVPIGAAVGTALVLWPDDEDERPARSLCFGSLSEATAAPIDDGKGGEASADEQKKMGKGDLAVLKRCFVSLADPGDDTRRGIHSLITEDTRSVPGTRKGSVALGGGMADQATATEAVAQLPAGCARRTGATMPYLTVALSVPSQGEKHGTVDRDTAIRNSAVVVRESAANLARTEGCS